MGNLVWIDLEMTGLENDHVILEIATLVTDKNLTELAEGPVIAIKRSNYELENINEWSLEQHTKSGLLDRVKDSTFDLLSAEKATLEFLNKWVIPGESPICGNSISTDRKFINREMPNLDKFLHYRIIDVSTIKELVTRWYPRLKMPPKTSSHLALDDVRESIEELRWYKKNIFIKSDPDE